MFKENPKFTDSNREKEAAMLVRLATLADGTDGVVLHMGRFDTCLTDDGARRLVAQLNDMRERISRKNKP